MSFAPPASAATPAPANGEGSGGGRLGETAVIFISVRNDNDPGGYDAASHAMAALAARQPGYRGIDTVRGTGGVGITVSYWADHGAAAAWRDNADHKAIRDQGRGRWYDGYRIHVCTIDRSYDWSRA